MRGSPACSAFNSLGVGDVCGDDAQCLRGGTCSLAYSIYVDDDITGNEVEVPLTKCACPSALSGNINATGGAACIAIGTVPLAGGCSTSAQCVSGSSCTANRCCALGAYRGCTVYLESSSITDTCVGSISIRSRSHFGSSQYTFPSTLSPGFSWVASTSACVQDGMAPAGGACSVNTTCLPGLVCGSSGACCPAGERL